MQRKKLYMTFVFMGILVLIVAGIALAFVQPVKAQCGSQASSCKNCHEVQGKDPVNNDGTGWHQSHAFGDFCYICHAGNQQATDKDAAHAGMVPPLSDVKAACQSCHAQDLDARVKVYADKLGVQAGSGAPAASSSPTPAAPAVNNQSPSQPSSSGPVVVENGPVIDYVQQYNESVTGKTPINWGNIIVAIMIVVIVIVGGAVVYLNERKLRGGNEANPVKAEGELEIRLEDYPAEVIALLPKIKALNPVGRKALAKLLTNSDAASDLLLTLSRLDPDLIKRMKGLDREAQALLIALAGD